MKNKKSGFSEIAIVLIIAAIIVAIGLFFVKTGKINVRELGQKQQESAEMVNDKAIESGKMEVSESPDLDTIEAELDATLVGDPEVDTESLNNDASSL